MVSNSENLALLTDLYELTMLQAYLDEGMMEQAVFSLAVRRLPVRRNYLLACGLDSVLEYLETLRFTDDDLSYLETVGGFSHRFLEWLRSFRFTGAVYAVPEGTPVFANEPIIEVVAPLPEAQLIETLVMNQINIQTILASKATRMVAAAAGRSVIDFAPRRMQGIDAALKGARAFYIAGIAATSNVMAGKIYGIPVTGTMAHSYIQAHETEESAFRAFTRLYPETTLLVDTYDSLAGVWKVIDLAKSLGDRFKIRAVRLDSGDLANLAHESRRLLDNAGLHGVGIFVSGGLDEDRIAAMLAAGAPIDGFGVGTSMGVSSDAPDLDIAYKLCEYAGRGRTKLSSGKPVLPGRKQIFRSAGTHAMGDVIARADENLPGQPLLVKVMEKGHRVAAGKIELEAIRAYACDQIARLPNSARALERAEAAYPVMISPILTRYHQKVINEVAHG